MIKVLHFLPSLSGGGISKILFEYCKRLTNYVSFDFAVSCDKVGVFEKELISMGCNVFHLPKISKNLKQYKRVVSKLITQNKYDIVHSHCDFKGYFELMIAKKLGVGVRIAHSHRSNQSISMVDKIIHLLFGTLTKKVATDLFACGRDAAVWAWGKRMFRKNKVFIMHNAIDIKAFAFSQTTRDLVRSSFGLTNEIVIGNVARFCYAKNHDYLIKVFNEIHKDYPFTKLMLVGDGEDFIRIKEIAQSYDLTDDVMFLGERNDVNLLLNAMDFFVMPSRFEGLPVSLVEVQANGLVTFASEAITNEVKISDGFHFFSIKNDPKNVAKLIMGTEKKRVPCDVSSFGYDIELESIKLLKKYEDLIA